MAMLVLPDVFARTWEGRLGPDPVLDSFWKEAIPAVLARHPRFLFIAEAYWGLEDRLHEAGFHFSYDKELYDLLRNRDAPGRPAASAAPRGVPGPLRPVHREPRRAARRRRRSGRSRGRPRSRPSALRACACSTRGSSRAGACGFPSSSPAGRRNRRTRSLRTFYERLLSVLQQPIFKEGVFQPVDVRQAGTEDHTNDAMVAATWRIPRETGTRMFLAVSNLAETKGYARIPLDRTRFQAGRQYRVLDHVDGRDYERDGAEIADPGLFIALEPYQAHVFEITEAVDDAE